MQDNKDTNDTSNTAIDSDINPTNTTDSTSAVAEVTDAVAEVPTPQAVVEAPVVSEPVSVAADDTAPTATVSVGVSDAKKQMLKQYGIATLVILIMGAGLMYALEQQGRVHTGIFDKVSALVNPVPAAAIVNGEKISKADYDKNLTQLETAAKAQGADVSSESIQTEIKKQAIDVLVNTELLRQAAYADGAMVTDEQVEARYQEILKSIGGAEQLAAKMAELGITEEGLRKDIEGEILIQGHLSKSVDTSKIAVSEKELTDAYTQIKGTAGAGVTVPPLDEIKTQLEAQLKTNKEQELVNAYITKLRDGANIEILI
jgi:FKBP-type peptidyl-prolyl cis-trans isomerase (trigger factor)